MDNSVTTTAGERFTEREHERLAALIWKRFGWNTESAAAAWRRMLGNSCTDAAFVSLAQMGAADVRRKRA
jgi:hypothetical protein